MKPLNQLDNIEKAELLHALFPDEMPSLLDFILNLTITIKEDGPVQSWNAGLLNPDLSFNVLESTIETIEDNRGQLQKRPRAFADNLFDGFTSMLTKYCIHQYITVRTHDNEKFVQCCRLLFS